RLISKARDVVMAFACVSCALRPTPQAARVRADVEPSGHKTDAAGAGKSDSSLDPETWRYLRLTSTARNSIPTTSPNPCSVRGSLVVTHGRLYGERDAEVVLLHLYEVELLSLELPEAESGRLRAVLTWPVSAEGWLEPDSLPLENTIRIPGPRSSF